MNPGTREKRAPERPVQTKETAGGRKESEEGIFGKSRNGKSVRDPSVTDSGLSEGYFQSFFVNPTLAQYQWKIT